jgi:prepilin peptidase CpaA
LFFHFSRVEVCVHSFAWWPTVIVVTVATVTDMRTRRIPNWLVLPFLFAGITASTWLLGWQGLGRSLMGLGLGLVLFGVMFFMGGMGAGDVKLAAAIGAWVGPTQLFLALLLTAILGGIMALVWIVIGRLYPNLLKGTGDLEHEQTVAVPAAANETSEPNPVPAAETIVSGGLELEQMKQQPEADKKEAGSEIPSPARLRVRKLPYAPAIALGTLISFFAR